jgi:hypothetical protein
MASAAVDEQIDGQLSLASRAVSIPVPNEIPLELGF